MLQEVFGALNWTTLIVTVVFWLGMVWLALWAVGMLFPSIEYNNQEQVQRE